MEKIFDKGVPVYKSPDLKEIRRYCQEEIATLWEEVLRFKNPHEYWVDLSKPLWNIKQRLLKEHSAVEDLNNNNL